MCVQGASLFNHLSRCIHTPARHPWILFFVHVLLLHTYQLSPSCFDHLLSPTLNHSLSGHHFLPASQPAKTQSRRPLQAHHVALSASPCFATFFPGHETTCQLALGTTTSWKCSSSFDPDSSHVNNSPPYRYALTFRFLPTSFLAVSASTARPLFPISRASHPISRLLSDTSTPRSLNTPASSPCPPKSESW